MNAQSQVVIITGGSSGTGQAIAQAFANHQAQVIIVGRRLEALREAAREIGPSCPWRQADVSRRDQMADAVKAILEKHSKVDVLVNNAGFVRGQLTDLPLGEAEQAWDDEIGTNLADAFLMTMATAAHLARPGGQHLDRRYQDGSQRTGPDQ
jgi:NAD(P)-dependent dehydrogenase (short-subunit alcohol dehydrogenase family)